MNSITQQTQWQLLAKLFDTPATPVCYAQVREALDQKTKPPGSLGLLETTAAQLALLQQSVAPTIETGRVIVFGADHGIADEGVSAFPAAVTAQMMANFANGGAAVSVLAQTNGMDVEVVDVGVKTDLNHLPSIINAKVASGTANFAATSAMTNEQLQMAVNAGRSATQRAISDNMQCIGLGEMGIGNTSAAAAIIALLLKLDATSVTGRGTGIDDDTLAHKSGVIQRAIEFHRANCHDAMTTLQHVGGFEIAAICGAILEANQHRLPVIVDGFISSAAALAAYMQDPSSRACMFFSHQSAESGHTTVLHALNARPLLSLDMRLGEGSAAVLAYPLLRSAASMMSNMSTFANAGVSEKST